MALFMDGFDYYDSGTVMKLIWDDSRTTTDYKHFATGVFSYGKRFLCLTENDIQHAYKSLVSNISTWYVGCHIYIDAGSASNSAFISLWDGTTQQCCIRFIPSGTKYVLEFRRGGFGGTVIATGTVNILTAIWQWFTFKIVLHGSTGTIDAYVNGVSVLSATGLNNISSANAYAQVVSVGRGGCITSIDNFHVYDGTDAAPFDAILAERRIYYFVPSGDGSDTDFTPSTGSRYQCLDENPPNTSDYISSGTGGHQNSVVIADLATGLTPDAVKLTAYVEKDDAGTKVGKLYNLQTATYSYGSDENIINTWKMISKTWLANPAGGAWDKTAVDASEWGIEVVS